MTPESKRVLTLLRDGHQLVRGPTGWRVVAGAGYERTDSKVAAALIGERLAAAVEVTPERWVYEISDAGRAALAEGEP